MGKFFVFHPVGPVGRSELDLIILSIVLVLIVIIPVMILLWFIVHRYRDKPGNTAPYRPDWSESAKLEAVWWGIPVVIVAILGSVTVQKTFALTKPPEKNGTPITIEVMSLDWKWLFLYPDQKVATVNYCEIPTNRPVQFVLTSDAPMNSFWVPQLGGQEYTMSGMAMRLWLQADEPGDYFGHGANFSGKGFAQMQFDVIAKPAPEFNQWAANLRQSAPVLTDAGYKQLASPSVTHKMSFSAYPTGLFRRTVMHEGGMYMKHDMHVLEDTH